MTPDDGWVFNNTDLCVKIYDKYISCINRVSNGIQYFYIWNVYPISKGIMSCGVGKDLKEAKKMADAMIAERNKK